MMNKILSCINKTKNQQSYKLSDIPKRLFQVSQIKNQIDIAVIDDQEFAPGQLLRNNNFKLTEIGDIPTLKNIEAFPIIICDIHGVGKFFNSSEVGGANLITEIRKAHPDKYLIAYSTHANDLALQRHTKNSDYFMPIASTIEQWTEALEKALYEISDPITRWKKFRGFLLNNDVDLSEIYKLEQIYIEYFLRNNKKNINLEEKVSQLSVNDGLKQIIIQFTATAMVELAKTIFIES